MPSHARLAGLALAVAGAAALPMSARKKHTLAETFKSIESDIAALERASASRRAAPAGLERMQENTCEVKDGCFTDGNQLREAMGEPKRKELAYNQALDEYKKKDAEEEKSVRKAYDAQPEAHECALESEGGTYLLSTQPMCFSMLATTALLKKGITKPARPSIGPDVSKFDVSRVADFSHAVRPIPRPRAPLTPGPRVTSPPSRRPPGVAQDGLSGEARDLREHCGRQCEN